MSFYINRKRYKKKCLCGEVNFPYGTKFCCTNGLITHDNKPICYNTSQDAYDYFSLDDDSNGEYRGSLVNSIVKLTSTLKSSDKEKSKRAVKALWNDDFICSHFKRKDHDDVWLWNYDFYNASIEDLEYVLNKIKNV